MINYARGARRILSGASKNHDGEQLPTVSLLSVIPDEPAAAPGWPHASFAGLRYLTDGVVDSAQSFQRVGGEFAVNQNTDGTQYHSNSGQTVTLANGNFLVVWADSSGFPQSNNNDVRARIFSPDGTPQGNDIFVHGTTVNTQHGAQMAALPDGGFVITWYDEGPPGLNGTQTDGIDGSLAGVVARVFSSTGAPVTGEIIVNSATADNQYPSSVTALSNGNFVVIWADNSQGVGGATGDNSGFAGKAQIFSAGGVRIGSEFLINEAISGNQGGDLVVPLANGTFAVVWGDDSAGVGGATGDNSSFAVKARLFAENGAPLGNEMLVNSATANEQLPVGVAKLANGGFVVGWSDASLGVGGATGDNSGAAAKAQIFDASGNRIGGEILINSAVTGAQNLWGIVALSGGGFAATWADLSLGVGGTGGDTSGSAVKAQVFAADGSRIGGEILVNTATAGQQTAPRMAATTNGGFVVAWSDASAGVGGATGDTSGRAVKAQAFAADGARIGGEMLVNTFTDGNQTTPQITALLNGGFAVNWQTDGSTADLRGQVYARIAPVVGTPGDDTLTGTSSDDTIQGLGGSDTLDGLGGNDILDGGTGADAMTGGAGDDLFLVDDAGDTVIENAGDGTDEVRTTLANYSLASLANVENLTGAAGAQVLTGNAGANLIDGGAGADMMAGGLGDDIYIVDDAGDVVTENGNEGTDEIRAALASYSIASLVNIENLTGLSSAGQSLTGNAAVNMITGGVGNDMLNGGAGADVMTGGIGNDTYFVDDAGDVVVEAVGGGVDGVYSGVSLVLAVGSEIELLSTSVHAALAAIDLTGNAFGQDLIGNNGANRLDGGLGADRLIGLGGDDTYVIDDVADSVVEYADEGRDTIYARLSYVLAASSNVEVLSTVLHSATDAINLNGNALAQDLIGNNGANRLDGGAGADRLIGLGGDDSYIIDDAGDAVVEYAGEGRDTIYTTLSHVLSTSSEVEVLSTILHSATDAIDLTGNGLAQDLIGNNGANRLDGGGGADRLIGLGGDDTYIVGAGGDTVIEYAGEGRDAVYARVSFALAAGSEVELLSTIVHAATDAIDLTGNELASDVFGNNGANRLDGGAAADRLLGLGGADIFAFTSTLGTGVDQILDFTIGTDKIGLDDAVFAGLALGALPAGAFRNGLDALDADDRIMYHSATGTLLFDADGNGAGSGLFFATVTAGLNLTASDFIVI